MLQHLILQAMTTAFFGFLIKESYGQAAKELSKRFKSNSEEAADVLTALLSLPGHPSAILLAQEHHLNPSTNHPGYLQSSHSHSINLPGSNISYPASPFLRLEPSFIQKNNSGHFHNLQATENVLTQENGRSLPNLLHNSLQPGSDLFTDPLMPLFQSISRTQESRNLNAILSQNEIIQDELLPTVLKVLLTEREKQIQMLASMLSIAIARPGIYAETYQHHRSTILNAGSDVPKYDLRGARFSGGFAETVQGKQIGPQYNYGLTEGQPLTEAAVEIQKWLQ